ncbi:Hypothetical protein NGAL_HAMBI2610_22680 [Neorhizobium galegae bv. orientalis]|nr:Hypothetical protein NGAL_HAMBI2610_22680 [Neorhizobium galegae bv. orientalis]
MSCAAKKTAGLLLPLNAVIPAINLYTLPVNISLWAESVIYPNASRSTGYRLCSSIRRSRAFTASG